MDDFTLPWRQRGRERSANLLTKSTFKQIVHHVSTLNPNLGIITSENSSKDLNFSVSMPIIKENRKERQGKQGDAAPQNPTPIASIQSRITGDGEERKKSHDSLEACHSVEERRRIPIQNTRSF